jgi:ligand-binding SRPBCC domain-containing protein
MKVCFEHRVSLPVEVVFHFHENPAHLELMHCNWPGFRLLHHDGRVLPGSTTWIEQSIARCVPVVLGFRHTIYEPPTRFGEVLIHGPFRRFTHIHEFQQVGETTVVRDLLDVKLPWRYGGELGMRLFVGPAIRRVFASRHSVLTQLAQNDQLARLAAS